MMLWSYDHSGISQTIFRNTGKTAKNVKKILFHWYPIINYHLTEHKRYLSHNPKETCIGAENIFFPLVRKICPKITPRLRSPDAFIFTHPPRDQQQCMNETNNFICLLP